MTKKDHIHTIFDSMGEVVCSVKFGRIQAFKDLGLGRQHFWALKIIAHHDEPISVKELSEKLNVTSGAVSQLLDPLVEKGFIERKEDASDRRVMRLELKDKAKETFKKLREAKIEHIQSMFDNLSEAELAALENLLNKIKVQKIDCNCGEDQKKS